MPAIQHRINVPPGVSVHAIEKPPCDEREYIGLIAENGMRILLISDPTAEKAAAALNVGVGPLQEDKKYGGVAHLLEHLLNMGSEKYPNYKMLEEFAADHGGSYCAYTLTQCTVYHFDILPKYFSEGMDMFLHMFIKPTFTDFTIDSEVNAVNQEYESLLGDNARRIEEIRRMSYNEDHPLYRFYGGNLNSLKTLPREANISTKSLVVDFYDRWYSSNIMNLAVSSKESLQELADMILPLINKIPNKNVKVEPVPPDPFENAGRGKLYKIATVEEQYSISIMWTFPNMRKEYRSLPGHLPEILMYSYRKGSLLEYLRQRGWAQDVCLYFDDDIPGCGLASLDITFSSDGFDRWEEIVNLAFQYLNQIRDGMDHWRFEEAQKILKVDFDHMEKTDEGTYTQKLAERMQSVKLEDILTFRNLIYDIKPHLTQEIIDSLKPSLCCILLMSQKFEDVAKIKEPYYGGMYAIEPIPDTLIQKWENCGKSSFLLLPPPNSFIPDKLELLEESTTKPSEYPVVIMETQLGRLWYKQDTDYKRPVASVDFLLFSPDICRDIETFIFYNIYKQLVNMTLDRILYDANQCGYAAGFNVCLEYITVSIVGYSDKLDKVCQEVANNVFFVEGTETEFDLIKENLLRDFRNFSKEHQIQLSSEEFRYLMRQSLFLQPEKIQAAEAMTYKRFMEMQRDMMKTVFIEAQIYGNLDENKAKECMDIMLRGITKFWPNVIPLPESQRHSIRSTDIPAGKTYVRTMRSPVHPANLVSVFYQFAPDKLPESVCANLFAKMFIQHVFDTLRTIEHLGYIAMIWSYREMRSTFVVIDVQSNRDYEFVRSRIMAVMRSIGEELNSMSEEKFLEHVESLRNNILEKPKNLQDQSLKWLLEFEEKQITFDRPNLEAEVLRNITKQDFIEFYKRYLAPDAPEKRRVTIIVRPEDSVTPLASEQTDDDDNAHVITDISPEIKAEMEKDEEILDIKDWVKSMPVITHEKFTN